MPVEYESETEYPDYSGSNVKLSSDPGSRVHQSFPTMGVVNPSHLGSKSMSPTKEDVSKGYVGDREEHMPLQFMPGSIASKMSPMTYKGK